MRHGGQGPLILGGTGCVGRRLARVWEGPAPLWQHRPGRPPPGPRALEWDMTGPAPDPGPISGVIHLARPADPADTDTAVALARAAARLADRAGVPLLLASSQAVYGPVTTPAREEETPPAPAGAYGAGKAAVEAAMAPHAWVCCLRIGNVAGCDMLLTNAARGPVDLTVLPDGSAPRRCYVGPVSLARILCGLLDHPGPLPAVLNLAQPGEVAMDALLAAAGAKVRTVPAPPGTLAALPLDLTRLAALVPLSPATPEGLVAEARAAGWGAP